MTVLEMRSPDTLLVWTLCLWLVGKQKSYKTSDSIQKPFLANTGLELVGKGPLDASSAQAALFDSRAAEEAGLHWAEINDFPRLPVSGDACKGPGP